ncbi:MAG: ferrous iron transport protein B [Deltaproteobacteria bacterium RBG_16_71_12]|nr:MAG: ferrous iron transport protein B [Deltaproteobacteria bacterium RBG_16_71_12]
MSAPVALLVGNPNSGKTSLFNGLTGLSAKVGNYPGITVEHREGRCDLGGGHRLTLLDLPGTYSLAPRSDDEAVAVRGVLGLLPDAPPADLILCVVDATALERNLYLVAQLRELPLPLVVCVTMTDTIEKDGRAFDAALLEKRLGVPVVATPAVRGGVVALRERLRALLADAKPRRHALNPPALPGLDDATVDGAGRAVAAALERAGRSWKGHERALGLLAASMCASGGIDKLGLPPDVAERAGVADAWRVVRAVTEARYQRVAGWAVDVIGAAAGEPRSARFTRRLDAIALHAVLGPVILVGVFLVLFQALFSWSTPMMDGIDLVMGWLGAHASALMPESLPLLRSLVVNGVVAGVGNVVVFVPQIAVLFLFLTILEDSGYLARAAFILDRLMAGIGLHGRAFVPLLSGFACAVPAIMATRTIESTKDRIVTILVTPFISCSARLPVYALMIATVFSTQPPIFGVIAPGALVMVGMYGLSVAAALVGAAVLKRTVLKSPTPPLLLELPPYRMPHAGQVLRAVLARVRIFLTEAGTIILAITVVLWALFTFPRDQDIAQTAEAARRAVEVTTAPGDARDAELASVDARAARLQVEQSIAGRLGHALEPALQPLGFDWKLGVGIIASFAAREVLVSTLGLVYGLGDASDENSPSLREAMRADRHQDGRPVYTPLTGLSLLVFFVFAMQCMSTLAAVKRETGGWRWPAFQLGAMSALAYLASLLVFQVGKLLGFS